MSTPLPPDTRADGPIAAVRRLARAYWQALSVPSHPPTPLFADAPRRWQRLLPYGIAAVTVFALLPITATVLTSDYRLGSVPITLGLASAQTWPLILAVTRPLQAWCLMFAADILGALLLLTADGLDGRAWPWPPSVIVGQLFLLVPLALRERRATLVSVWVSIGAAGLALGLLAQARSEGTDVLLFVLSGVVLLAGGALRERGDAWRRLAEQESISEAERSRRTLLEERARIARELHDVVAHHMSVITVQADSAAYRIDGLPPDAREEFTAIAATARESLSEMRRLLGVLRSDADAAGERSPQPGLDRIGHVLDATRRAGVPVELDTDGAPAVQVPQAVDLSAYRIVQEALANVVRHAPGARTTVSLTYDAEGLTVLVVNGPGTGPPARVESTGTGTGHGLVGMRERVRLLDGSLDTGPLPDGGYRVAARLPTQERNPAA